MGEISCIRRVVGIGYLVGTLVRVEELELDGRKGIILSSHFRLGDILLFGLVSL